jgi:hypothetical protein
MVILKYSTLHCKDTIPKIRNKYSQKRKLRGLSHNSYIHSCFCERYTVYIPTIFGLPILLQENRWTNCVVRIYRPRNSFSGNTSIQISLQCILYNFCKRPFILSLSLHPRGRTWNGEPPQDVSNSGGCVMQPEAGVSVPEFSRLRA